jgi:hypothetical protein
MTAFASLIGAGNLFGQLGSLPSSAITRIEISGVRVEIGVRHLIELTSTTGLIPGGLRPIRAESLDVTADWPSALEQHPEARFAIASFAFVVADTIVVDGTTMAGAGGGPATWAFWWILIDQPEEALDPRALGEQLAVQVGSWYSDPAVVEKLKRLGVAAALGAITVRTTARGWDFSFEAKGIRIRGSCDLQGQRRPMEYPLPAFSTVWHAGAEPTLFAVYTYQGHRGQACTPSLSATGDHLLAASLARAANLRTITGITWTGWEARAGIYRHFQERPRPE